jgi:hypothetical protein
MGSHPLCGSCRLAAVVVMLIGIDLAARERVACTGANRLATIDVLVLDYAQLPRGVLMRAEEKVTLVYRSIPIETTWRHARSTPYSSAPPTPVPPDGSGIRITFLILSPIMVARHSVSGDVLAATPRSVDAPGRLAFVFYDHIAALAHRRDVDEAQILGYVMAHEIGHMLLPVGAHTEVGVMRHGLDSRPLSRPLWSIVYDVPSFSPGQIDVIRGSVACE